MEGHYDLLRNPINSMWAINCLVEEDTVRIGALYLEPGLPNNQVRLSHDDESIMVTVPDEYLRRTEALRAWNVELPFVNESAR